MRKYNYKMCVIPKSKIKGKHRGIISQEKLTKAVEQEVKVILAKYGDIFEHVEIAEGHYPPLSPNIKLDLKLVESKNIPKFHLFFLYKEEKQENMV